MLPGYARELKNSGLKHSADSLGDILGIINSYLPEEINAGNWRSVNAEPIRNVYGREGGVLYPIYNDIVNFRNIWLVELLEEKKQAYDKIYIVMPGIIWLRQEAKYMKCTKIFAIY